MPTITLRNDDVVKNDLEALARGRGQSVSDLLRFAINAVLMRDDDNDRVTLTPASLTLVERQQLALLHRILARVIGEDNDVDGDRDYQLERACVLEAGFVGEYEDEFAGIRPELTAKDCGFLLAVLDMFRLVTFSIEHLHTTGEDLDERLVDRLRFRRFDLNDAREGHLLAYARYLVNEGRWPELQYAFSRENDQGNSHHPSADTYQRMLDEHQKIESTARGRRFAPQVHFLSAEELERLADAQVHPENR